MRLRRIFAVLLLLAICSASLVAQEIKLASVAPESSPYGAALNRMAAEWSRISNGRVRLRVYHNAIAGTEADVIRKMRIGQLQAAVLTSAGMNIVVPEVFSVSVPFMIGSQEELDYVMERIEPELNEHFEQNRLHVLAWSRAGWVHFFSRHPVTYPEDLKRQRLAADPNDQELLQAFRIMGYRPIPMPQPDLLTSLNSGLVDAFYTSPLVAAGFQWFALAPNMLDLKVAPYLGAIVITDVAWRRIPDALKNQLLRSADGVVAQIDNEVRELERQALETMRRYGLRVQEVTAEVAEAWRDDVQRHNDAMLDLFDARMTARIQRLLADFGSR